MRRDVGTLTWRMMTIGDGRGDLAGKLGWSMTSIAWCLWRIASRLGRMVHVSWRIFWILRSDLTSSIAKTRRLIVVWQLTLGVLYLALWVWYLTWTLRYLARSTLTWQCQDSFKKDTSTIL